MDQIPLNRDKTSYEQPLPVHLNISPFDNSLSQRPGKLKDFMHNYIQSTNDKEIFELQKGHATHTLSSYNNFFFNKIANIFTFTFSIISMITITLVIYLCCKHKHIRTLIVSLMLHKAKEVEAKICTERDNSECGTLAYIGIALTLLSMVIVILLHYRKSKFCRGHRFSNIVKIVLFISDVQHYIPIKLYKTSGSHHLSKIIGTLKSEDIRLNKNYLWGHLRNKLGQNQTFI